MSENSDWNEVSLESIADEITVGYVGPMASEYVSSGIPFLRSTNIQPYRIDLQDVIYIGEAFNKKIQKSALSPGDVVIVRTGKPGTAAVIPENLQVANCSDMVIVRPGRNLDSRFLAYYVNSAAQGHIAANIVGAVQQHFNVGSAKQLKLRLPSLPEQRAIARILGALDDKIELNRRMNHTLEAMAQALFKSWFVDFDPVTAKAEGRTPYGMPAETAALFPTEFADSELGAIPKGWRVVPAGEAVTAVGGTTPSTGNPTYWDAGTIAWATPKDLSKLVDPVLLGTERKITPSGLKQISSGLLPAGTVLMSSRAPVGYLAIPEIPVAINQGFIAMLCNKGVPKEYVLQWLGENMETIISHANGTTFMEISKTSFRAIPVLLPSELLLSEYSEIAGKYHRMVVENLRQSHSLASIRDALLPRLLSGEVRVKGCRYRPRMRNE